MFEAVWDILPRLLDGLARTILLLFACSVLSLPLALGLALAQMSRSRPLRWISEFYVFIFRGVPALVQLFFVYYGFSMSETLRATWAWYFFQSAWFCGIFALTLNTSAYSGRHFPGCIAGGAR